LPHDLAPVRTASLDAPVRFIKSPSDCSLFFFGKEANGAVTDTAKWGLKIEFRGDRFVRRRIG